MNDFIVYSSHLKPSKIKGDLPNIFYTYIGIDSLIGWHYTITNERQKAYVFDESELKDAEFIADCWNMKIKELF